MVEHTSHSAIERYLHCGKAFELERVQKHPAKPAWWFIGGSAVHKATEWIDRGEWDGSPEDAFDLALYQECKAAKLVEPDESLWLKAGYGARAQGYPHWAEQGPRYVRQWADREFDWDEVELDISCTLPSGIPVKGYVDRLQLDRSNSTWSIVDMKTSSSRPDSDQQLGIYTVLFKQWLARQTKYTQLLFTDTHGGWSFKAYNYMFKDDEFYEMDVSNWTLDAVDKIAQEWKRGVESEIFIPRRGKQCSRCAMAEACYIQSGDTETTRAYDRLNPHYTEG